MNIATPLLSLLPPPPPQDEMDPYEKLLSPHRVTRTSSRQGANNPPSVASGSSSKMPAVKEGSASPSKGVCNTTLRMV